MKTQDSGLQWSYIMKFYVHTAVTYIYAKVMPEDVPLHQTIVDSKSNLSCKTQTRVQYVSINVSHQTHRPYSPVCTQRVLAPRAYLVCTPRFEAQSSSAAPKINHTHHRGQSGAHIACVGNAKSTPYTYVCACEHGYI